MEIETPMDEPVAEGEPIDEAAAMPELRGETIIHQTVSEEAVMAAEFEELCAAMDSA